MTSFECVTGRRLPSSSMRAPVCSSISSSTRTMTRWCTLAASRARGTAKRMSSGSSRRPCVLVSAEPRLRHLILASDEVAVTLRALATRFPAQQPAGDVPR